MSECPPNPIEEEEEEEGHNGVIRTSVDQVLDRLLGPLMIRQAWIPAASHWQLGRLRFYPRSQALKIISYTDMDPDCPECGPYIREEEGEILKYVFASRCDLHLMVVDKCHRDALRRMVTRHDGKAAIVPIGLRLAAISTVPLTNRAANQTSVMIPSSHRDELIRRVLEPWRKGKDGRISTVPKSAHRLAEMAYTEEWGDREPEPSEDIGSIKNPAQFVQRLAAEGKYTQQPNADIGILHALWCDRGLQQALENHGYRPPAHTDEDWDIPEGLHNHPHHHYTWKENE